MSANLKVKEPNMKLLFAFGLAVVVSAGSASAQIGSQNALGGKYASVGMSRPLGGISPTRNADSRRRQRGAVYATPYAFSFYVPSDFDSFYGIEPPYQPPQSAQAISPAPPVIINQYFNSPPPSYQGYQAPPPRQQQEQTSPANDPQQPAPGDNYYLIAYKNHSVYTALAYWVEDKTLNYVTSGNTRNQATLDLIDLDLTKTLNQARGVPFSIENK
jgi:hypothetical protein